MSIKLLDRCWRFSKSKGGDLLVLLGIADFSNDDGVAYPSVPTLAKKARLTHRNAQRAVRRLVAKGELLLENGKGPHGVHFYRIVLPSGSKLEERQNDGVTNCQGDIHDLRGATSQPYKPSEETVIQRDMIQGDDRKSPPDSSLEKQSVTADFIHTRWNALHGVKPCKDLGDTIRQRINARLKAHPDLDWWNGFFKRVQASNFLCGRTSGARGPFHASLTWILSPTILDNFLAGNYDPINSSVKGSALLCTKRIQNSDDRFLRQCGNPANPQSLPTEPRCLEHLPKASKVNEVNHVPQ